jgi:hypothetical protein
MMPTIPARNANLDLQTLMPEVTKQITRGTSTRREQEVCNLSANGDMSANGNIPDGDDDGGAVEIWLLIGTFPTAMTMEAPWTS